MFQTPLYQSVHTVFELHIRLLYVNHVSLYVAHHLIDLDYQFIKYKLYCPGSVLGKNVKWEKN